jgi:hypothetical protein
MDCAPDPQGLEWMSDCRGPQGADIERRAQETEVCVENLVDKISVDLQVLESEPQSIARWCCREPIGHVYFHERGNVKKLWKF